MDKIEWPADLIWFTAESYPFPTTAPILDSENIIISLYWKEGRWEAWRIK